VGRSIELEIVADTSQFSAMQLQPRTICSIGMNGWACWAREHLVPFRRMIEEHRTGVVVVRLDVRYLQPFGFFDADSIRARVAVAAVRRGVLLHLTLELSAGDRCIAEADCALRPVLIGGEGTLAAQPGNLPPELLALFPPDEIVALPPGRTARALAAAMRDGPQLAQAMRPLTVHRHECEVADQWSFIELAGYAAAAREALVLGARDRNDLGATLARPLRSFHLDIARPLYIFDRAEIATTAVGAGDGLRFVHEIGSGIGSQAPHALVVERF
jgi:acyl-CoA thioesterase FadM